MNNLIPQNYTKLFVENILLKRQYFDTYKRYNLKTLNLNSNRTILIKY